MKDKALAVLLCILLTIGLVGCGAKVQKDESEDNIPVSEPTDNTSDTDQTEHAADTTESTETETDPPASSEPEQPQLTEEKTSDNPTVSPSRENGEKTIVSRPVQETPPKQNEPSPPVTAAPQPEPTAAAPIPAETEPPVIEKSTEPPAPVFHIDHWIEYAQTYAKKVNLELDPTAIYCWDNPIRAHARCIYLERDIQGRLDIYAQDEDITCVWVWAEPVGKEEYDIFIGYA